MEVIIVAITSYLMGSIPFGFILTKIFLRKDIRNFGSGNIGATNALRTGNKSLGYGTLLLDVLKAIIPVIYIKLNYPDYIFITSIFVFIGHVFPLWLKFKGGKGVAPYVGILFSIKSYLAKIRDKELYAYGVYQIEANGRSLFSKIEGDEDTIMGLPVKQIKEYLSTLK